MRRPCLSSGCRSWRRAGSTCRHSKCAAGSICCSTEGWKLRSRRRPCSSSSGCHSRRQLAAHAGIASARSRVSAAQMGAQESHCVDGPSRTAAAVATGSGLAAVLPLCRHGSCAAEDLLLRNCSARRWKPPHQLRCCSRSACRNWVAEALQLCRRGNCCTAGDGRRLIGR